MRKRLFGALMILLFLFTTEAHAHKLKSAAIKIVKTYNAKVSWYKHGHTTANGEKFNPYGHTVAHKTLPFGTLVRFTNPSNNKRITVRVNDRGPFIRGREFDLSKGAAIYLGFKNAGVVTLKVEIIKLKR